MKKLFCLFILVPIILIQPGYGQEKPAASEYKGGIPAVSLFISADYFSPKFTDVNAVFNTIERNYSLPAGKDFKDYYNVLVGIRFAPVMQQSIQVEFGGSVIRSRSSGLLGADRSSDFLQMYYTGGTYLFSAPVGPINFFLGAGLGYDWLRAQRSYSVQPGVARVNAGLTQLHGLGGFEYINRTGVTITLEAGYSYATTLFSQRSDIDFTLKGVSGGIKVGVPLVKVF